MHQLIAAHAGCKCCTTDSAGMCGSAHVVSLLSTVIISMETAYSGELEICISYFLSILPVMMQLTCEYMEGSLFLNSMVICKLCDIFCYC